MIIKKQSFKSTPWLNGQGTTSQVFIQPPHAQLSMRNFTLRISLATLTKKCKAFSKFQSYHRYLALLQGGPIHLCNKIMKKQMIMNPKKQILSFQGEETWECQAQSEGRDFNFFVKKQTNSFMNFEAFQGEKTFTLNKGYHFFFNSSQKQFLISYKDQQFILYEDDLFLQKAIQHNIELRIKGANIQLFHCYAEQQ